MTKKQDRILLIEQDETQRELINESIKRTSNIKPYAPGDKKSLHKLLMNGHKYKAVICDLKTLNDWGIGPNDMNSLSQAVIIGISSLSGHPADTRKYFADKGFRISYTIKYHEIAQMGMMIDNLVRKNSIDGGGKIDGYNETWCRTRQIEDNTFSLGRNAKIAMGGRMGERVSIIANKRNNRSARF